MLRLILKRTIKQDRYNMILNHVSCKLSEIDEEYVSLLSRIDQAANNEISQRIYVNTIRT